MIQPSREAFRELARDHTVVPVWRTLLADFVTPVSAFARIVDDGPGFLLESVERGERGSRYSFVGRNPLATLVARDGGEVEVRDGTIKGLPTDQGILAAVEWLVGAYRSPELPELPDPPGGGDGPGDVTDQLSTVCDCLAELVDVVDLAGGEGLDGLGLEGLEAMAGAVPAPADLPATLESPQSALVGPMVAMSQLPSPVGDVPVTLLQLQQGLAG